MNTSRKLILAVLVAALLFSALPAASFAQDLAGPPLPGIGLMKLLREHAADLLNMSPAELLDALRSGKRPREIAEEAGLTPDVLQEALQESWQAEQAEGAPFMAPFMREGKPPFFPRPQARRPLQRTRHWVTLAAEALNMPVQDLARALLDGKTPAQIAQEQGVSIDDLLATILAEEKARLDQAVADGLITQEEADRIIERVKERVDRWANRPLIPVRPGR
jgi:uncharacterized protein (DUF433 family)